MVCMKGGVCMNMIPVSSSNLASVGYENNTLYVSFNNGALYSYASVPRYVYEELLVADSHGKYLASHIKGIYPHTRLR